MSQRSRRLLIVAFVALLVPGPLAGCNLSPAPPEEKVETVPKVQVEKVTTIEIPAQWPKDIPIYPGAQIVSETPTVSGQSLTLKTEDTAAEVFNWYFDRLDSENWIMPAPMLDVARNVASISGTLDGRTLRFIAQTAETEEGYTSFSITADLPVAIK